MAVDGGLAIVVLSASILGKLDVNKSRHKHMGHRIEFSENDPQLLWGTHVPGGKRVTIGWLMA
jgi:hypothetical protein